MDTPETKRSVPWQVENSPDSNIFSTLSPLEIKVQPSLSYPAFSLMNFQSPPAIFTSPHVPAQSSYRFLQRHQSADTSRPEFGSENGSRACNNEGVSAQSHDNSAELPDGFTPRVSTGDASAGTSGEHSRKFNELPQSSNFVSCSADVNPTSHCNAETDSVSDLAGPSNSLVVYGSYGNGQGGYSHNSDMWAIEQITNANWDDLPCNYPVLNKFPGDSQMPMDPGASHSASMLQYSQQDINNVHRMPFVDLVGSGVQHLTQSYPLQPHESVGMQNLNPIYQNFSGSNSFKCINSSMNDNVDITDSYMHRGMRRRCLDFDGSTSTSIPSQANEGTPNNKQLVPTTPGIDTSRSIVPGIGMQLNAVPMTSMDYTNVKHELPNTTSSLISAPTGPEPFQRSLASAPSERDVAVAENGTQRVQDASQASVYSAKEEVSPNSPKKRRRKGEDEGGAGTCKRCTCKKTKCLKLYCECFAAGIYCTGSCSCQDCFNNRDHESTIIATRKQIESRNPLAFAPKVIRPSDSASENGDESNKTPASARHKRGCNCKKSGCLKKYCECFQGGVGCSINCRCENCQNAFGRKDGSSSTGAVGEPEGKKETREESAVDISLQKTEVQDEEEQNPASGVPATPLPYSRPLVQQPFSTTSKPPRSTFVVGASSINYPDQKLTLGPQEKFETPSETIKEDEMPDILRNNVSPGRNLKAASPNSKRVAPPNHDCVSPPARKSSRKLDLQSIPSFPPLNPHQ